MRLCLDCDQDISDTHLNRKRCALCAANAKRECVQRNYQNNREKRLAQHKQWRKNNPDYQITRTPEQREERREYLRGYTKEYYQNSEKREKHLEEMRKYYQKNRELLAQKQRERYQRKKNNQ